MFIKKKVEFLHPLKRNTTDEKCKHETNTLKIVSKKTTHIGATNKLDVR